MQTLPSPREKKNQAMSAGSSNVTPPCAIDRGTGFIDKHVCLGHLEFCVTISLSSSFRCRHCRVEEETIKEHGRYLASSRSRVSGTNHTDAKQEQWDLGSRISDLGHQGSQPCLIPRLVQKPWEDQSRRQTAGARRRGHDRGACWTGRLNSLLFPLPSSCYQPIPAERIPW